jgi:hypothetical protein
VVLVGRTASHHVGQVRRAARIGDDPVRGHEVRKMTARPGARLISIQQIETEIGIPADSIDKLIRTGELRVVELPHVRRRFIDRLDLEAAIESWKVIATGP